MSNWTAGRKWRRKQKLSATWSCISNSTVEELSAHGVNGSACRLTVGLGSSECNIKLTKVCPLMTDTVNSSIFSGPPCKDCHGVYENKVSTLHGDPLYQPCSLCSSVPRITRITVMCVYMEVTNIHNPPEF